MNFTRDPIIETVITPREGCKLVVRNSKGIAQEDYLVEALEVVSFGHSLFFRSQERPKSFLVPVSDYEVFEAKEPKMLLKNPSAERSIKIGGGRDISPRPSREAVVSDMREEAPLPNVERGQNSERPDRKRDRQRRRGRKGRDRHEPYPQGSESGEAYPSREEGTNEPVSQADQENGPIVEAPKEKAPSFISKLFPPPTTLIKETLSRYKTPDPAAEDLISMARPNDAFSYEENGSFEEDVKERSDSREHSKEMEDREEDKEE